MLFTERELVKGGQIPLPPSCRYIRRRKCGPVTQASSAKSAGPIFGSKKDKQVSPTATDAQAKRKANKLTENFLPAPLDAEQQEG
jgi:hypothetical protein